MPFVPSSIISDDIAAGMVAKNEPLPLWFIFYKDQLLIRKKGREVEIPRASAPSELNLEPAREIYLGTLDEAPCFAVEVQDHSTLPGAMKFRDLRMLLGNLDEEAAHIASVAVQLLAWDRNHQFCGRCGQKTISAPGERLRKCESCSLENYPRITPAVIVAVTKDDRLLLASGGNLPEGMYSVIAGFVEPGESPEQCVAREVMEETGIRVRDIRYFGSQPWPFPHTLMLGFTAEYESGEIQVDGEEIRHAEWYRPEDFPPRPDSRSIAGRLIEWFTER